VSFKVLAGFVFMLDVGHLGYPILNALFISGLPVVFSDGAANKTACWAGSGLILNKNFFRSFGTDS